MSQIHRDNMGSNDDRHCEREGESRSSCGDTGDTMARSQWSGCNPPSPLSNPVDHSKNSGQRAQCEIPSRPTSGFRDDTVYHSPTLSEQQGFEKVPNEAGWDLTDSEEGCLTPKSTESRPSRGHGSVGSSELPTGGVAIADQSSPNDDIGNACADIVGGSSSGDPSKGRLQGLMRVPGQNFDDPSPVSTHGENDKSKGEGLVKQCLLELTVQSSNHDDEESVHRYLRAIAAHSSNIHPIKEDSRPKGSKHLANSHKFETPKHSFRPAVKMRTSIGSSTIAKNIKESAAERPQLESSVTQNKSSDTAPLHSSSSESQAEPKSTISELKGHSSADKEPNSTAGVEGKTKAGATLFVDQATGPVTKGFPVFIGLEGSFDPWHWTQRYGLDYSVAKTIETENWKDTAGWWTGTIRQAIIDLANTRYGGMDSCVTREDCERIEKIVAKHDVPYQRRWEVTPDSKKQSYERRAIQSNNLWRGSVQEAARRSELMWHAALAQAQKASTKIERVDSDTDQDTAFSKLRRSSWSQGSTGAVDGSDAGIDIEERRTHWRALQEKAEIRSLGHKNPTDEPIFPFWDPSTMSRSEMELEKERFARELFEKKAFLFQEKHGYPSPIVRAGIDGFPINSGKIDHCCDFSQAQKKAEEQQTHVRFESSSESVNSGEWDNDTPEGESEEPEELEEKSEYESEKKPEEDSNEAPEGESKEKEHETEMSAEEAEENPIEALEEYSVEEPAEDPEEEPEEEPQHAPSTSTSSLKSDREIAIEEISEALDILFADCDAEHPGRSTKNLWKGLFRAFNPTTQKYMRSKLDTHRQRYDRDATFDDLPFLIKLIDSASQRREQELKRQREVAVGFRWVVIVFFVALTAFFAALPHSLSNQTLMKKIMGCFELVVLGSIVGSTFWVALLPCVPWLLTFLNHRFDVGESLIDYYETPELYSFRSLIGECEGILMSIACSVSGFLDSLVSYYDQHGVEFTQTCQENAMSYWFSSTIAIGEFLGDAKSFACEGYRQWLFYPIHDIVVKKLDTLLMPMVKERSDIIVTNIRQPLDQLYERMKWTENTIDEMKPDIADCFKTIIKRFEEIEEEVEDVSKLEERVGRVEKAIGGLESKSQGPEMTQVLSRLRNLEIRANIYETRIKTLESQVERKMAATHFRLGNIEEKAYTTEARMDRLRDTHERISSLRLDSDKEIAEIKIQVKKFAFEARKVKGSLNHAYSRIQSLESQRNEGENREPNRPTGAQGEWEWQESEAPQEW